MKNILLFIFILISSHAYNQKFDFLPASTTGQIIKHSYYTLSYSANDKQAEWVAYELTRNNLSNPVAERTENFRPDTLIKTGSASLEDYKGCGYDRGHLTPAADMKFNTTAMSESFYLSNMSPQSPEFNRGIWAKLEEQVRIWAMENDTLYIVTGGILSSRDETIGEGKVTVPAYFYKVILNRNNKKFKAIALILPNEKGNKQLYEYATTIDSLENITGIDFFPALPDSIENNMESKANTGKWSFDIIIDTSVGAPPVQCKGVTNEGIRCRKYTTNTSGYCDTHKNQENKVDMTKLLPERRAVAVQCSSITQKGTRCSRKTYSPNGKCWQHGGD
ncbi:MAG: DNA/RNA non-specific endonuclease [Bacteroidota bacterium]